MLNTEEDVVVKQKRGRKPKNSISTTTQPNENINLVVCETDDVVEIEKHIGKKRGRKPKGGKIVQQLSYAVGNIDNTPSVILHLKCCLKDLCANELNTNIESYNFNSNKTDLSYEIIETNDIITNKFSLNDNPSNAYEFEPSETIDDETNDLWKKLKQLEHNLHINNISDKKSSCFWCTYEFDNPPVYIPKQYIKDSYHVYGCFCSPECSVAFLMEENIDTSTRFERYYLLNHIYSKIYNYQKSIKPAPNPYYMLEKYYGNLTIHEYRSLLSNERLFFVVDKPLTRILPELHEDNDDFIINNKIIPSNTYTIKRKSQKYNNKNKIVSENFGPSITSND